MTTFKVGDRVRVVSKGRTANRFGFPSEMDVFLDGDIYKITKVYKDFVKIKLYSFDPEDLELVKDTKPLIKAATNKQLLSIIEDCLSELNHRKVMTTISIDEVMVDLYREYTND